MNPEPTVFVVDDDQAVLESMTMLLGSVGIKIQTYSSCQDFLDDRRWTEPGCLVLDIRMPQMSGMELHRRLAAEDIEMPVIILTGHGDVPMAVEAVQAGVVDFIEKPCRDQILLDAINRAIKLDLQRRKAKAKRDEFLAKKAALTPRETQIMDMLIDGKTNKEIGFDLGISVKTVDYHRLHILDKTGVNNTVQLVNLRVNHDTTQ